MCMDEDDMDTMRAIKILGVVMAVLIAISSVSFGYGALSARVDGVEQGISQVKADLGTRLERIEDKIDRLVEQIR